MDRSLLFKFLLLAVWTAPTAVLASVAVVAIQPTKTAESLSNLIGAMNQVIADRTPIAGETGSKPKITPPAQKMAEALNSDLELCQTSKTNEPEVVSVEKDGVSVKFKKFDLHIYGEKCPLEISVSLNANQKATDSLQADFAMKVIFKSESYVEKYKLKHVEIAGAISALAEKKADEVHVPVHLDISGQGESTDLGVFQQKSVMDIKIDVNMKQFSFNMLSEQTATLQYADVKQKGYTSTQMQGFTAPVLYFAIDDKEVSQTEYQTFMQSFVMPDMISDQDPNAPDAKMPTQCLVAAYDKTTITVADLKAQLQNSVLQPEGLLASAKSCSKNVSLPFKKGDQSYAGNVTFDTDWISFSLPAGQQDENAESVYVLYQDAAPQVHETKDFLMGLRCQPVPACN